MSDYLKDYEKQLFGGFAAGELHIGTDHNGTGAQMWLMDSEFDPVRISFCSEGTITIHTEDEKWVSFSPDQLRFIADSSEEGEAMTIAYYEQEEQNEDKT